MAYVLLYGNGWTQRWQIAPGATEAVMAELDGVGSDRTARLPILDPSTSEEVVLAVAWRHVASAVVVGGDHAEREGPESPGLYR